MSGVSSLLTSIASGGDCRGGGGVCMQFACAVGMFVRAGGTQGSRNCQKLLEDSTNAWALPVYKLYNVCGYMEEARGASHRHEMYRA